MMLTFAASGVDPDEKSRPAVKEFYARRDELLFKAINQLTEPSREYWKARRTVEYNLLGRGDSGEGEPAPSEDFVLLFGWAAPEERRPPAEFRAKAEAALEAERRRLEVLDRPYPNPLATYPDALRGVKQANDLVRQQKVELSKRALDKANEYRKTLVQISDISVTVIEFDAAFDVFKQWQILHKEGKLTRESADKAMATLPWVSIDKGYKKIFDTVVACAKDFRANHDPDCPTIYETHQKLFELFGVKPPK